MIRCYRRKYSFYFIQVVADESGVAVGRKYNMV